MYNVRILLYVGVKLIGEFGTVYKGLLMGWNSIPVQGVAVKAPKGMFYVPLAWKYLWQLLDEGYISLSSLPSVWYLFFLTRHGLTRAASDLCLSVAIYMLPSELS